MSGRASRFGSLAQAVKDRAAAAETPAAAPDRPVPDAPGLHRPAMLLGAVAEGLRERIARLEAELTGAQQGRADLQRALDEARAAAGRAGEAMEEFLFLDPSTVRDPLPRDRLPGAFAGPEFEALLGDIRENGQNDAITVRRTPDGTGYEVAAGRRRLEACRQLGRAVLARIRELDEAAMLRVQFSENERREDISALERARWFAEVKARLDLPSKDLAAQFGLDPSTLSLYLRLSRFPSAIIERLRDPRRLAVLRARRVMEALDADPEALGRILAALDQQGSGGTVDPDSQVDLLLRAAEGRAGERPQGPRSVVADRRHVVHRGRRVGTLTRNGGQWVFRFATSVDEEIVHALADRLGELMADVEAARGGQEG